jgi:integrase
MRSVSENTSTETDFPNESLDLSEYIDYLKGAGASPTTIKKYCRWIEVLTELMGERPDLWRPEDLTRLVKEFSKPAPTRPNGYARATRMLIKAALRRYWESAGRTDLLAPGAFWRNGRQESRYRYIASHTASPEEVSAVIEECRRIILDPKSTPLEIDRFFMMFLIAAYGIRCKAVSHFRLQDFDLDDRLLHIYRTKGDKSRTIYMDVPMDDLWPRVVVARERLIKHLIRRRDDPKVTQRFEGHHWLFFTKVESKWGSVGKQLHRSGVGSTIRYLTKRIVGRNISPHAFRHAKVFSLLDQGWKIERVAAYMGHTSVQTTFQYVHLGPNEMKAEAERVASNGNHVSIETSGEMPRTSAASSLKALYDQGILSKDEYLLKMESILGLE